MLLGLDVAGPDPLGDRDVKIGDRPGETHYHALALAAEDGRLPCKPLDMTAERGFISDLARPDHRRRRQIENLGLLDRAVPRPPGPGSIVTDSEEDEITRQRLIVNGMPCVKPFAENRESLGDPAPQSRPEPLGHVERRM